MATISNLFHQIGNCHNQISIIAGVIREVVSDGSLTNINEEEIGRRLAEVADGLNKIEKAAIKADKIIMQMKPFIYKHLKPDQDIPQEGGN